METKNTVKEVMPNGYFKKYTYSFGRCFSWVVTIFCLLFGEPKNEIHSQLAVYSFLAGVAFTFALVFKTKINIPWFKYDENNNKSNKEPN
jgi:hypothetical protein